MTEKNKQTITVIGILGAAGLLVILFFYFNTFQRQIARDKDEAVKLKAQIDTDRAELGRLKAFLDDKDEQARVAQAFIQISRRLPATEDIFEVFNLLRGYFENTDVQFTYLEPGRATNRGLYTEYPFTVRGTARYHEFGQLLNLVECNPERLMHVNSFRLVNSERRPSIHPMELTVATFTFNDRPPTITTQPASGSTTRATPARR